jgi:hypothetical protein
MEFSQIKTTNLLITHTTKYTIPIKEQKGKNIASFIHKQPQKHKSKKKNQAQHHQLLGQWVMGSLNRKLRVQSIRKMKR